MAAIFGIWNKPSGVMVLTNEHKDSQLYTLF